MSEFFKQLIGQLNTIWGKLSSAQKVVISAVLALSLMGLVGLVVWSAGSSRPSGMVPLYTGLELEESGSIVDALREAKVEYQIENNGGTIMVPNERLYEMRMQLAKQGLPKSGGIGYEIFDKNSIGQTDFVQKLNYMRALEGELARTIQTLDGVLKARVHIVIPKPTLFTDKEKDPTASVVLKLRPGSQINVQAISGIAHVVASSVEGLQPRFITVMDVSGRLLSNPYGGDEVSERSSHQIELQNSVEHYIEAKVATILNGVLGVNKSHAKTTVVLDFDQIERNVEKYNPDGKVIRSEERNEEQTTNSPQGDSRKENSITNYEIDKTVEHIVTAVGTIKRLSVSVAVDGTHKTDAKGNRTYVNRTPEELGKIEDLVKASVGYDVTRGDQITVTNVEFDNEYLEQQLIEMQKEEQWSRYATFAKYALILTIVILFLVFVRYLARTIVEALNPPVPEYAQMIEEERPPQEIPENIQRTNEIMQRVEMLVQQEPVNVAALIRTWLGEAGGTGKKNDKKKE